jgi:hypothetical protein
MPLLALFQNAIQYRNSFKVFSKNVFHSWGNIYKINKENNHEPASRTTIGHELWPVSA